MIEILINHLKVDLPSDFQFSMEYENEFFTKSADYSLDIELPLKDSVANQAIFGPINRLQCNKNKKRFKAEAYVNGRCVANGYAELIKVNDDTVTIQLLGGTSFFNYSSKDLYIDELDLGYMLGGRIIKDSDNSWFYYYAEVSSQYYKDFYGSVDDTDMVFFWSSYKDPSKIESDSMLPFQRHQPCHPLPSFSSSGGSAFIHYAMFKTLCQPYIVKVIERVMQTIGYKVRRNDIAHCWLRNIYVVNFNTGSILDDAPGTKIDKSSGRIKSPLNKALPHWRLSTFISEVEKFCSCIFVFNDYNKTVDIKMLHQFYDEQASIQVIESPDVLDEYEFEFSDASEANNVTDSNVSFDLTYANKYLCVGQDIINSMQRTRHANSYDDLVTKYNNDKEDDRSITRYVDDSNGREYIEFVDEKNNKSFVEINVFGTLNRNADKDVSLKIVPANTSFYNVGWWFDQYGGSMTMGMKINVPYSDYEVKANQTYSKTQEIIENGFSTEEKGESSDCIQVMLNTGDTYHLATYQDNSFSYPIPFTDFRMKNNMEVTLPEMSLSLKPVCSNSLGMMMRTIPRFDSGKKFLIRFISARVPDSRSIFLINSQKYVCYKLSIDFNHSTTDYIVEGEFYRMES